ncbi:hypothetical protein ACFL6C_04255 [Myxococcota bacterium]
MRAKVKSKALAIIVGLYAPVAAQPSCGSGKDDGFHFDSDFECVDRPEDSTGYLKLICEFLAANLDRYEIDPNTLEIEQVIPGDEYDASVGPGRSDWLDKYANSAYHLVGLNCCYTGDWAVIEVDTETVVDFSVGDV